MFKSLLFVLVFFFLLPMARSQTQPTEITLGFAVGGPTYVLARALEQHLQEKINLQSIVVSRPGAEGKLSLRYSLAQPPNGKNLLILTSGMAVYSRLLDPTFDAKLDEFETTPPIVTSETYIILPANSRIKNLKEFISHARNNPVNCAIGYGGGKFSAYYIKHKLDLKGMRIISYKGTAESSLAVMGGHVDCAIDMLGSTYIRDKIKIIASTGSESVNGLPLLKDYIPGFVNVNWQGVAILKSAPDHVKKQIFDALRDIHKDAKFQSQMAAVGFTVRTPDAINSNELAEKEYQFWINALRQNPKMLDD